MGGFFVVAGSAIVATDIRLDRVGLDLFGNLAGLALMLGLSLWTLAVVIFVASRRRNAA